MKGHNFAFTGLARCGECKAAITCEEKIKRQKNGNVHKPLSEIDKKNLNRIFSIKSKRKVNNDFTIQFKNKWHQLTGNLPKLRLYASLMGINGR